MELATVLRVDRRGAVVDLPDGTVLEVAIRGRIHRGVRGGDSPLAVGDSVRVERTESGDQVIASVEPRRTVLLRPEIHSGRERQVLAANMDVAVLVFSTRDPPPSAGLIDRLLVGTAAGGVTPVLVLNKGDLPPEPETEALATLYTGIGYRVLRASAETGDGLPELRALLHGRCAVLAGPSGTGKTSLVNRLYPGLTLRTGEISRSTGRGRHTTTAACLVRAPEGGGHLVDTPGIREFGLVGIASRDLALHFPEFPAPGTCRFHDCRHVREPGCSVLAAVQGGLVSEVRYRSYRGLLDELEMDQDDRRRGRPEPDGKGACTPGRSP